MKKYYLLIIFCLSARAIFAQTSQQIEADLLKSFKHIDYWDEKKSSDTTGNLSLEDSLEYANTSFAKKLKSCTTKYPGTINQKFNLLKKEQLDIFSSTDSLFRIYSWDTWEGGTMHDFANVLQYKVGQQTKSVYQHELDLSKGYIPFYSNLYTFKINQKTYYLGIYGCIFSTKDAGTGIKVFDIENGKLNSSVKIFKTASGLQSDIYYDYNFFSVVDIAYEQRPTITFDAANQTIHIPLVKANGDVTKNYITYKFTGQYFERMKN